MGLTRDQKAELLRSVELFAGLDAEGLASIGDHATEVSYPAGRWIVRQGEIGTGFFLIMSGRARVVRDDDLLTELGPGDFFGELSLVDQQPRIAHVITNEPTDCLAIASWDFEALLETQPRLTLALLRGVVRRLRETGERHHH
jgi:CRP-like cAMP-binding protein